MAALAEYLCYRTEDRAWLSALLWAPAQGRRDVVVFVPGYNGSFTADQDYEPLVRELAARRVAFMAVNLRTANDFTDPKFEDALPDIRAAIEAAKAQGFSRIALFGTSFGAPRCIYYLANGGDPAIQALGLIAPILSPYEEAHLRFEADEKRRLEDLLKRCRALVAEGRGSDVVSYENWFKRLSVRMTARGYLSIFGAPGDTLLSVRHNAARVRVPVGIFHGTADKIALAENAQALYDLLTSAPSRELFWIEGGTHVLEAGPVAEAYARAAADWLEKAFA